jgi:transketolase|tara:strand:+ start:2661 stop:3539 length:879 start_codon:yes stop_codon:yes gene_type:complete
MRKIFIKKLVNEASKNKKIILIVGDLGYGIVEPFKKKFPDRFFNAGVAEQSMAGLAAGLALRGFHVFIYSIANFPTFRCAEQIRNDIDYHNLSVTIVSVGSGLGYGNLGYSHHAIQDYALLRSFPNTIIASPSNNQEVECSMDYLLKNPQPSYLRLDKSLEINSNKKISKIYPGKWIYYNNKSKNKKLILSTGSVFKNCKKLFKQNKSQDWATLPIWGMRYKDQQADKLKKYKQIVTVENHLQDGGFGSWLSESIIKKNNNMNTKIISKFLDKKVIGKVGSEKYLNSKYGLK